jgi:hypothetical protein
MTLFEKVYLDVVPVYAFVLFLISSSAVFMLRSPVVVITDDVFSAVYGPRREHVKRIEMCARLFRRIKLARIAENAELDAVVFAVQDAGRGALAAVFPYRYYDAALRYAALSGEAATVVMAGLNKTPSAPEGAPSGVLFVKQDEEADFYRAGLCSALFSARRATPLTLPAENDEGKNILVMTGRNSSQDARDFFERGLRRGGSRAHCDFITGSSGYYRPDFSCVVFWGPANDFLYGSVENTIPNIIFSWIDPEFSSPNVKVIIDDSPLQLLPAIVKPLLLRGAKERVEAGENMEIAVPSAFKTMCLRTGSLPLSFLLTYISVFDRIGW